MKFGAPKPKYKYIKSDASVMSRKRLKLPMNEIRKLYLGGMSTTEIAEKYGTCYAVIGKRLREMGIPRRKRWNFGRITIHIPKEKWKLAYMAGIVDGEGSICFCRSPGSKHGKVSTVCVANTSMELLEWMQSEFGGGRIGEKKMHHTSYARQPQYQWRIRRTRDTEIFLKAMLPYLIVKKKNCEEHMRFLRQRFSEVN